MRYKRIPCGKGKYRDASPTDILCLLDEFEYGNSTEWTSKLLLVDITPPPDLLIPFLMSRNEKNRNQQSLAPIVKKWYAGCEIMEALRLGYTLNKVHAYYEFPYYQTLFETFISNLYQERLDHPTGARNLMAKFAMNSVSGKHGQRNMDTKQSLFVGPDSMQGALKQGYKVGHSIMDQDNHMMGFIGECQDHPESTPFALQVTVWILAWSRVHMSTFIDHIGGYRNHKACPKYGDTDSVFVEHAIASKADPIYYGKALGQFKNEMPDCKLMELIILAPKTYMKIYWGPSPRKNDEYQLYCQVTCKGIPHSPSPYLYHGNYQVDKKNQKRILHIYNWIKEKQAGQHEGEYYPSVVLRDQYYLYQEEGVQTVYTHLTPTCFKKVAQGKGDLTVIFGSMQRNLQSNHLENMVVGLDYKHRLAIRENYWEGTNRVQGECYFYKPIF